MSEKTALQRVEHDRPATLVSLSLTAMDIAEIQQQTDLINQLLRNKMIEARKENNYQGHYGVIPGTKQKSLMKPGAEMIAKMFRLGADYEYRIEELPGDHINVVVTTKFVHYPTQTTIGYGVGSCSTMESKHRYRTGPVEFTGKPVPKEFWDMRSRDPEGARKLIGGSGHSVKKNPDIGQWEIVIQGQKVENQDPADQWNTALKIAKKRSYVDGIQTLTAAGDIFMVNAEGSDDDDQEPPPQAANRQTQQAPPKQEERMYYPPKQEGTQKQQKQTQQTQASGSGQALDQNGFPLCPKCGGPMWDNRKGYEHAASGPDFACKDKDNCRFKWTKQGWVPHNWPTSIYRWEDPNSPEREPGDDEMYPPDADY